MLLIRAIMPGTVWYGTVRCGTRVYTVPRNSVFHKIKGVHRWSARRLKYARYACANSNKLRTPALAPSWSCLYLSGPARNDVLFLPASLQAEHVEFTDFGS